jgi:hypothetical protein
VFRLVEAFAKLQQLETIGERDSLHENTQSKHVSDSPKKFVKWQEETHTKPTKMNALVLSNYMLSIQIMKNIALCFSSTKNFAKTF